MRTNIHDYGHGGAYVRKCEVRALAYVCSPMAFIVALLSVLLVPNIALADSSVIWGPSVLPSQDIGVVVNAPDKYRAAALVLGYGDDKVSTWSDEVLAKLSNESTGGAFYTFAQKFGEVDDAVGNDNPLTAVVSAVGNSFWAMAETLYGDDIWLAGYSALEFSSAASALSSVLAGGFGGDTGGGSGDTSIPQSLTFTMDDYVGASNNKYWGYASDSYYGPLNVSITISTQYVVNDFSSHVETLPYHYYALWRNGNLYPGRSMTLDVYFSDNPLSVTDAGISVNAGTRVAHKQYDTSSVSVNGANNISLSYNNRQVEVATYNSSFQFMNFARPAFLIDNQSISTPVVPPTQWPEEPSAPTPPELPEPGTNPTVTPTPWAPVISPTFDFDLNITTEPTSNDLIDWVKKIYYELRSFHSDEQDWFDEVGKGMDAIVDAIDDAQEQIYGELQTIDETLRSEGQKIRDYVYQMFHWLKDQLNFQNNTFDDNNIVYWLKRIWSKLGNGDINLRPTDPTNDPDDWWDWLVKAIQNFLIGLAATSTELISEIADLASQVMHEFPFSIPWDIAAVLAALSTAPVTPVFTITVPAVSGWWASFDFVIDMSPFDGAAETIRLMEKLLFTGLLIWKSKDLLEFMDVTKWFN